MAKETILRWSQGEDLVLPYIYEEGPTEDNLTTAVLNGKLGDGSAAFSARMDFVSDKTKEVVFTASTDPNLDPSGVEVRFVYTGENEPNIRVKIPRSSTLPGGEFFDHIKGQYSIFRYDFFLRNNESNEQTKIDSGVITIEKSYTQWQ